MKIAFRKIELIPAITCFLALLMFLALGFWQLDRLAQKNALIAATVAAKALPALEALPKEIGGLQYRAATISGRFLYKHTLHLIGVQQGEKVGYYMVTPLELADGRVILVNRGWASPNEASEPAGVVKVSGILRPTRIKRMFAPENQPEKNVWFYEDLPKISATIGKPLLPLVLEATGKKEAGVFPIPNEGNFIFRNDHLQYAVTWFSFALITIVMFGVYYRKKPATN